ncbi:MAG TPA: EAL domain-containing response regulator [Gammaproteobacteria bacterium]
MSDQRLLIMDDDPVIGRTIGLMAESIGMQYRAAVAPEEFFQQLGSWNPTHIVLDLVMPEMDGVEIMRQLADRACKACIIISSGVEGRIRDAARRAAVERNLDVVGVLSKPFKADQLRSLVQKREYSPLARPGRTGNGKRFEVTEGALWTALEQGQFELVYQPKISCATRALVGFEALVRWRHPEIGVIMPDRFIPLAETVGLIDRLTEEVLQQGLCWMTEIQHGPVLSQGLSLAVNLSTRTLVNFQFADQLARLCRDAGFDPTLLTLELTETAAMEDPVLALDMMTRLRMKGIHLSIDDFGTGYSSMLQLSRLPFSEIKIDRSFVMSASWSSESRTIIKSIVDLGHNLGLKAVAEGVEDEDTLRFLEQIGCDNAQGFLIARPMAGEAAVNWVLERHRTDKGARTANEGARSRAYRRGGKR